MLIARTSQGQDVSARTADPRVGVPPRDAPYRDARRTPDDRAHDLLARMTVEEKFWQLFMIPGDRDNPAHDYRFGVFGLQVGVPQGMRAESARSDSAPPSRVAEEHARRIMALQHYFVDSTRLGIPMIPFEEMLHGLAREGATTFPQAIALAATWDTALLGRVGRAIAAEGRSRGIRMALSPVVNIANDVRWGRVEETYGEDTFLASAMARAYVGALEHSGVVATPKHFVANVGDGGRDSYPIEFSPRLLEERYFPPFVSAIHDAGARAVMTAYNSVDGTPASQNAWLMKGVLRDAWRFDGIVISDAAATGGATVLHNTEASVATSAKHAIESGLDVIFQSSYEQHTSWLAAFKSGVIDASAVDSAVLHVLRLKFSLGLFESPYGDPDAAGREARSAEHLALAREAAAESMVLLKNTGGVLPLGRGVRSVAVIGLDATEGRTGGYSPPGAQVTTILEGLRAGAPAGVSVAYAGGVGRLSPDLTPIPAAAFRTRQGGEAGVDAEYFDNIALGGTPVLHRREREVRGAWTLSSPGAGVPLDWFSARWSARLTVPARGARTIAVRGNDGYRLWLDGRLAIDNWRKRSFGTTRVSLPPLAAGTGAGDGGRAQSPGSELGLRANIKTAWTPGSEHDIRLEYFETAPGGRVELMWDAGVRDTSDKVMTQAVAFARRSDVSVIVAGIEEGEFRDRARLGLPGRQEELIRRVAATGKPVVVVLVGGSAITMPWLERVGSVLDAWYPGAEGGRAVADVLFGRVSPAGRLPITFPLEEGQLPLYYAHKPTGRGDDYLDLSGAPLFPFGHGLSYTSFTYDSLHVEVHDTSDSTALTVRFTLRNTGRVTSDEVPQLYLHDVLASVARPVLQLAGFTRVRLEPGESRVVTMRVQRAQLAMLDADMRRVVEPGQWRVYVGASSRDLRLRSEVDVR